MGISNIMVPPETPGTGDLEAVQSGVLFEPLPLLKLEYHHSNRCLRIDLCEYARGWQWTSSSIALYLLV